MLLIVGLGNPGEKYNDTPHNAGFRFVDMMSEYMGWDTLYSVSDWKIENSFECEIRYARAGSSIRVIFIKPHTYMNSSGRSIKKLMSKFQIKLDQLIVAHDDLDIKLGEYKIQIGKGPKGHNGIESVQNVLGSTHFLRVRIGVESRDPENKISGEQYVLSRLSNTQFDSLNEASVDALKSLRKMLGV